MDLNGVVSLSASSPSRNQRTLFDIDVLTGNHREIRRLRREVGSPSHHGNKVWNSSIVLMDYLSECTLPPQCRVLEIGCGWGIAGIFCAKRFSCEVTGSDIDASVFPFMDLHASLNGVKVTTLHSGYEKLTGAMLGRFDLMIGGDICFWDHLETPLFNLIRRAAKAGVRTVLTDPGRPPFTAMAQRCADRLSAELNGWAVPAPHSCSGYVLDVPSLPTIRGQ